MRPGKVSHFRRAFCFSAVASGSSKTRALPCYDIVPLPAESGDPGACYRINARNLYTNGIYYPSCFTIFEQIDY